MRATFGAAPVLGLLKVAVQRFFLVHAAVSSFGEGIACVSHAQPLHARCLCPGGGRAASLLLGAPASLSPTCALMCHDPHSVMYSTTAPLAGHVEHPLPTWEVSGSSLSRLPCFPALAYASLASTYHRRRNEAPPFGGPQQGDFCGRRLNPTAVPGRGRLTSITRNALLPRPSDDGVRATPIALHARRKW